MIIDAHSHIFPWLGSPVGGNDPKLAMQLWQYHNRDNRRFYRKSDGVLVETALLEFDSEDLREMPDVNYRFTRYGRAEFTVGGVDHIQYMYPPAMADMDAPPERVLAQMNIAGVDMTVLQHDHMYGELNAYYGEQMRRYPGRFIGLAQVREWEADHPAQRERLVRAIREHGNKGLYFSAEAFMVCNYQKHLDDASFEPFWDTVRELKIPVWWYIHSRRRDRWASFFEHLA